MTLKDGHSSSRVTLPILLPTSLFPQPQKSPYSCLSRGRTLSLLSLNPAHILRNSLLNALPLPSVEVPSGTLGDTCNTFYLLPNPLGSRLKHLLIAIPNRRKEHLHITLGSPSAWHTLGPPSSAQAAHTSLLALPLRQEQGSVPAGSWSLLSVNKSAPAAGTLMEARQ